MFRLLSLPYLHSFEKNSIEIVLKRSLRVLDTEVINGIKRYTVSKQTLSGGFEDKAGNPDLYYTLFGFFIAEALGLNDLYPSVRNYTETFIHNKKPEGVYLHCTAILASKLDCNTKTRNFLKTLIHEDLEKQDEKRSGYDSFLHLLSCYYLKDYVSLYRINKRLTARLDYISLPCTVASALLVLRKSFRKPVDELVRTVLSFYDEGGFKATFSAPAPDLLSTAVALYALRFADSDLRMIKPECLGFVDSLYDNGGFAGNIIDNEADIEYTFYGLIALGSLSE
ncbi:MAG TPA: hypothetical protein VHO46_13575 [Bacteroidales bacterium]|nr:hypothetical protein [Bacteroidales bacterium]